MGTFDLTIGAVGNQGPPGPQGVQGKIGPAGSTGAQGVQGKLGAPGMQGTQGVQGEIGPAGANGAQGVQGKIGPQGPHGTGSGGASLPPPPGEMPTLKSFAVNGSNTQFNLTVEHSAHFVRKTPQNTRHPTADTARAPPMKAPVRKVSVAKTDSLTA